jgi:hypothetical protein
VFGFEVELGDAHWASEDPPVRASYQIRERGEQDGDGILSLSVKRCALKPGQPVRWAVSAGKADSQRWFGIYEVFPSSAAVTTPSVRPEE